MLQMALRMIAYLERRGIITREWQPVLLDLNLIENIWSLLQHEVERGNKMDK
jgi:hypothetical protein